MARVGRRPRRDEDGFGLVEVMLSLSVLLVVLVATSYLVDNVVQQAATAREKVAATELAEQWLEQLSNSPISSLQAYIARDVKLTPQPVTVAGVGYTVWGHLEWGDTGATHSLCTTGNPPQVIRATVTVKWAGQAIGETTVMNPPYGTVVPGDGFLSIQIYGLQANSPPADTANLVNVPVTVTPVTTLASALTSGTTISVTGLTNPVAVGDSITIGSGSTTQVLTANAVSAVGSGTQTITVHSFTANGTYPGGTSVWDSAWGTTTYNPDQFGCVYVLQPLGDYTESLGSPSGGPTFIDNQENPTPISPVQFVTVAGLPVHYSFTYDEAGTVAFSPSAAAPIATGMPISVSPNASLQTVAVPLGSSATSALLFPYTTAYSVWYGDCQPPPRAGTTMEEPSTPATVSVTPQGSSSVAITGLGVLTVQATRASGNFTGAVSATATITDSNAIAGSSGDGCPVADSTGGETFGPWGLSGSTNVYTSQTAILPQTYKITVTDSSVGGGSASTTVTVGSGGATATVTVP